MAEFDVKVPTSKEEMEALRKMIRREIDEKDLDKITGGNDLQNLNEKTDPVPWICPFCGAIVMLHDAQDGIKHVTACPRNPYK